jgi:hypothetical protein
MGFHVAVRRFAQQDRAYDVPSISDEPLDQEPALGHKETARPDKDGVRDERKFRNARVVRGVDRNKVHAGGCLIAFCSEFREK